MITIAHRLSSIMLCDLILVLDKGHLVETGAPKELLADASGLFARMAAASGLSSIQ